MRKGRPKTYQIDDSYFENIDNQHKAYILGFIYADGSISKSNTLSFGLHKKDVEILEFIKKELKSEHPIKINKNYAHFRITCKKLGEDLKKLNIIQNKTYNTINLPYTGIYFKHFLRGFFDGDGSIYTSSKKINDYCINFSNNYYVLEELKFFLKCELNINSHLRLRRKNNYNSAMLEFKGSLQIQNFYNFLYEDSIFFLKRKHNRFQTPLENAKIYQITNYQFNGTWDIIKKLFNTNLYTQKKISDILNIPYSSVRNCIRMMRLNSYI